MYVRLTHSRHALIRRLIFFSLLLFPWPVLAEEVPALPLSKIVLYSSGVGYFQHDGTVNNRMQLDLRLHTNQINDMLKSLIVQDFGGGRALTVTYGSHDPVTKTLGSFGVNLNDNPTLGQIWKLAEPKEPTERTRDLYRFSASVDLGKSAALRIKETLPLQESILLMESGIDQIVYYQQAKEVSQKVKEALQRVVQLRNKLDETRIQRTRLDHRTAEITAEHTRIRENMQRLQQNSELYNRYVKKLDQQETGLENLRKEIENIKNTEEEHRRELQNFVMNLDVAS